MTLVDKLKLPQYGWTSVANYWCPHYNMVTLCTTGTHATFIPPEDHRDAEKVVLGSKADVLKWTTDFPRDEIDREDGSGLEFECQLNTPSLARLHQLRKLGGTNIMALRKTLLDKQDLLQMDAGGFVDEGYHTTRGGGESEPEPRSAPCCASNAKEHGRPQKSIQKDCASHAERTNPKTQAGMT